MDDVSSTILSELGYLPVIRGKADYRLAIIGAGRIALRRQLPAYRHAGLNVVAVADIQPQALENARRLWGIEKGYLDYRQMLERERVDIVDICTATFPRKQITLDAVAAGKHVLSEKPFARTFADAREMVEAADRAGVTLAVHQPTRWYYPAAVTRELIRAGLLGEIFYIELRLHGDQDSSYYRDPVTRWHAELEDHIFVEWGAHYFDVLRWFAGGETPESVFAWGTTRGNEHFKSKMAVSATARFASGAVGSFSLNQASRFVGLPMAGMTFRVEGTEGTAAGDLAEGMSLSFASRLRGGIEARFEWTQALSREEDPTNYLWFPSIRDGHLWPMVELINSLNEGREPQNSARDNLHSVRTYLAAMRSDREYRPVALSEIGPP
jgi:predicted dehydrogenase